MEWISVEERLPEQHQKVFAFVNGVPFYYMQYVDGEFWDMVEAKYRSSVSHWMPLPPPPEKEDGLHSM